MPEIGIGVTRMAFFVQQGHFARDDGEAGIHSVTPRTSAGVFAGGSHPGGAVFAPAPAQTRDTSAWLAFSWAEHQAYRARVILPARFAALSPDDDGAGVTARVGQALDRVRPVGVTLEVTFADDQWTLGEAALPGTEAGDELSLIDQLAGSTVLWPAPEDAAPPAPIEPS